MSNEKSPNLLFKLPAELRDTIWDLALPDFPAHWKLTSNCDGLEWLTASREIFVEAGARFYSNTCFYDCSSLSSPSDIPLTEALARHLWSSFGRGSRGEMTLAGSLVKELVVDLRVVPGYSLDRGLKWYFQGMRSVFPNLKKLYVYFGPTFMARDSGLVYIRHTFVRFKPSSYEPSDRSGKHPFEEALKLIGDLVPQDCRINWLAFENWMER